jgi:hypothetical protein
LGFRVQGLGFHPSQRARTCWARITGLTPAGASRGASRRGGPWVAWDRWPGPCRAGRKALTSTHTPSNPPPGPLAAHCVPVHPTLSPPPLSNTPALSPPSPPGDASRGGDGARARARGVQAGGVCGAGGPTAAPGAAGGCRADEGTATLPGQRTHTRARTYAASACLFLTRTHMRARAHAYARTRERGFCFLDMGGGVVQAFAGQVDRLLPRELLAAAGLMKEPPHCQVSVHLHTHKHTHTHTHNIHTHEHARAGEHAWLLCCEIWACPDGPTGSCPGTWGVSGAAAGREGVPGFRFQGLKAGAVGSRAACRGQARPWPCRRAPRPQCNPPPGSRA